MATPASLFSVVGLAEFY